MDHSTIRQYSYIHKIIDATFLHNLCFFFSLLFYLQQYTVQPQFIQMPDNLVASYISLRLPLLSSHFHGIPPATTSGLTLKCTAHVPNLYDRTSEVELGTPQRDPIPARGKHAYKIY